MSCLFDGNDFMVLSGSFYSGSVGRCIEYINSEQHGHMLKLELNDCDMWFNLKELKEF